MLGSAPPRSTAAVAGLRWLLGCGLTLLAVGCGEGTEGRAVSFELELAAAGADGRAPGSFSTATGWSVELEQAWLSVGPVRLYENPPPVAGRAPAWRPGRAVWDVLVPSAHAHPGDVHFNGGAARGEWLEQRVVDLCVADVVQLGVAQGEEGRARSFSVELAPPRASTPERERLASGSSAFVRGVATRAEERVEFEGQLTVSTEGTQRVVDGVPADVQVAEGLKLRLMVRPDLWFAQAHFDRLTEVDGGARRVITPDSQPGTAWYLGARSAAAFTVVAQ